MSVPDFGSDDEGQFAAEIKAIKMPKAFLLVAGYAVQKLTDKAER